MALEFDGRALRLLQQRRPGQALLITVVSTYALPIEEIVVEWCPATICEHDTDLVYLETRLGVPIYVFRRIAAYLQWNALRVTVWSLAWWHQFTVTAAEETWHRLLRWERSHPGLKTAPALPSAA